LGLHARILLLKKDSTKNFWPRLAKDTAKHNNIAVNWDGFEDEDEEGEKGK
jgi:hypothetical protein